MWGILTPCPLQWVRTQEAFACLSLLSHYHAESFSACDGGCCTAATLSTPWSVGSDVTHDIRVVPSSLALNGASQEQGIHSSSGQPVPVPQYPLNKELLPTI